MRLCDDAVLELIDACELNGTDLFLCLGRIPAAEELKKAYLASGGRTLTLFPGPFYGFPAITEPQALLSPAAEPAAADIRLLSHEGFSEALAKSGVRRLLLPFYECADVCEYGYRFSYQYISSLRASLPFSLHVTGVSIGEYVNERIFEALGTGKYLVAGQETKSGVYTLRTDGERETKRLLAERCEKQPYTPTVILCPTRTAAEDLHASLLRRRFSCGLVHGGRTPEQNGAAISAFAEGKIFLLCATKAMLPSAPFLTAAQVFYFGLPYSLPHAYRCASLSRENEITCVYSREDIALLHRLNVGYAQMLGDGETPVLTRRETMLSELLNAVGETEYL